MTNLDEIFFTITGIITCLAIIAMGAERAGVL
jgi:hypothetical protein